MDHLTQSDKNSPACISKLYTDQWPEMEFCQDVEKGTLHIRSKGTQYLSQEHAEDREDYQIKLNRAILHPGYSQTKAGLIGLVFKQPLKLETDVPELIRGKEKTDTTPGVEGWAENIDNSGTSLNEFAKDVFDKAIRDGHCFIIVDMPPSLPAGATRADEIAARRRPYWVVREKSQAINWRTETVNGVMRLAQITFKECSLEADGAFGETEVTRYRVLRPGQWEIWRKIKDGLQTKTVLESNGTTSLNEIPVAVVYSKKYGFLQSRPLLIELAHIVIQHYQKEADFNIYEHVTSKPVLCERMGDQAKPVQAIGPFAFLRGADPAYHVWFAEVSGAALGACRQTLKELEERMSLFGMSLLITNSKQRTATESIQDDVAEKSPLQAAADSLKDGLEQALMFTAEFIGEKTGGSVNLGKLETLTMSPEMARVIFDAMGTKLSLETGYKWLQTGKLPETFDPAIEADAVQAQARASMEPRSIKRGNQWEDDDFTPIAAAIEALFKQLGWQR
jgi:hypothetical protein